jgi:hypothetical protein
MTVAQAPADAPAPTPEPTPTPTSAIDLSQESWDRATEVADGFWVIAARHRPGYSEHNPLINNRVLVFRLMEAGKPVLVVVNGIAESAIPKVRGLAEATQLPVRYNISPGGGHHVTMDVWHEAFPTATMLLPPARIPRTENGKKLLRLPRVALLDPKDPLPQFRGQLDAVLFDGLFGFRDNLTPREGGPNRSSLGTLWAMMKEMPPKDPIDELWIHHVATGTVVGGENLGWMLSTTDYKEMSFLIRAMMKPNTVYVLDKPRKVAAPERVSQHWHTILSWPMRALMTYHDSLGVARFADCRTVLETAVKKAKQI